MTHKPHILIVTDAFVPPMQGTRMRNLAQNLQQKGYNCELVCEVVDSSVLPSDLRIIPFRYLRTKEQRFSKLRNLFLRFFDKLFLLKEKLLERMLNDHIDFKTIDVIIASAYLFPLRSVRRVADQHKVPFVLDLRDIVEQWNSLDFLNFPQHSPIARYMASRYIHLTTQERNYTLSKAQAVVSVSEWHVNQLKKYHPNVYLVYNGYNEKQFFFIPTNHSRFCITYTGKLYNSTLRNPELLFAALQILVNEGSLQIEELELRFYIEPEAGVWLQNMAMRYQLASVLHILPFVNTNEVNKILSIASIVLILNNPSTDATPIHGVLTTKFYEAIGAEKPILCIPADHDCLQNIVESTHCGLSSDDLLTIQRFILDKYAEWKKNGFTRQAVNPEQKKLFSRQYQAQQFERILLDAIHDQK